MPFTFTLDKISKLGDYDETYGQRYWCESPNEEKALSFNSKENIELTETSGAITITAEERAEKQSKKGTLYYQLKKVKVSGSGGQGSHPPVDTTQGSENPQSATVSTTMGTSGGNFRVTSSGSQLDRIEKKVNEIHNRVFNNGEELPY